MQIRRFAPLGVAVAAIFVLELFFNTGKILLFIPVLINLAFLAAFGFTVISPPCLVESFARQQVPHLSDEQISYCRSVTVLWSVFFAVNGTIALWTALWTARWGDLSLWTLYNGLLAYVLIALLFVGEITYRYWKFRVYSGGAMDWFFRRIFPPGAQDDE